MSLVSTIRTRATVSITDLRRNPGAVIEEANGEAVAVLNHNKAAAYLLPADMYEDILDVLDDKQLADIVRKRRQSKTVKVKLDEL
jgi:antitoxin StbD